MSLQDLPGLRTSEAEAGAEGPCVIMAPGLQALIPKPSREQEAASRLGKGDWSFSVKTSEQGPLGHELGQITSLSKSASSASSRDANGTRLR